MMSCGHVCKNCGVIFLFFRRHLITVDVRSHFRMSFLDAVQETFLSEEEASQPEHEQASFLELAGGEAAEAFAAEASASSAPTFLRFGRHKTFVHLFHKHTCFFNKYKRENGFSNRVCSCGCVPYTYNLIARCINHWRPI